MIHVQPNLARLSAYVPPWVGIDRAKYLRLDLNECTQPLPPVVVEQLARYIREKGVQSYPDYTDFLPQLSAYCGLPTNHLLLTNGSDEGIVCILRALLAPGDSMVIARPEFAMFGRLAEMLGVKIIGVPYGPAFEYPYQAFDEAIPRDAGLIVIINPNNPTGTPVALDYVKKVLREHPDTPVLVDEAYYEYTGCTAVEFLAEHENLILLRTFSKAFAMAGLRLGYVMARPEFIAELKKVRGPFDVNCLALQAAGGQLAHPETRQAHLAEVMNVSKPFTEEMLRSCGIEFVPGAANFLLAAPPDRDRMVAYLKSRGILVFPMRAPRLEKMVRMSFGTLAEMQTVRDALTRFVRGA